MKKVRLEVVIELVHSEGRKLNEPTTDIVDLTLRVQLKHRGGNGVKQRSPVELPAGESLAVKVFDLHYGTREMQALEGKLFVEVHCAKSNDGGGSEDITGLGEVAFIPTLFNVTPYKNQFIVGVSVALGSLIAWAHDPLPIPKKILSATEKAEVDENLFSSINVSIQSLLSSDYNSGLMRIGMVIVVVTVLAAIVERVVEVAVSAYRKPRRELLEAIVKDAERAGQAERKSAAARELLFRAETNFLAYRSDTRLRALSAAFLLGCIVAYAADITLLQQVVLSEESLIDFFNVISVGALVAGGAEPLHKLVTGVSNVLGKTRNFTLTAGRRRPRD